MNEWNALGTYLGGNSVAGGKLKESGYSHWASPNKSATDVSKFTGLPGSSRNYPGLWSGGIGTQLIWWSSTPVEAGHANSLYLSNNSEALRRSNADKKMGLSVRCIKGY